MKYTDYKKYLLELKEKSIEELKNNKKTYYKKLFFLSLLWYIFIYWIAIIFITIFWFFIYLAFISHHWLILLLKAKFLFLLLIPAYIIIKTLFIKIPEPVWNEIKKEEFPKFFEKIEKIRKELWVKIHKVILVEEVNAFVSMIPRFWMLFWNKNILGIGFPLVLGLSEEELKSIIFHEFWHIVNKHSKFWLWIYKTKVRFWEFFEVFENQDFLWSSLVMKFFEWYNPKLNVYSFSLMREQEKEADNISVSYTSEQNFKKWLINLEFLDLLFVKYNKKVFSDIYKINEAPKNFYTQFSEFIKNYSFTKEDIEEVKKNIKQQENDFFDTHPSLEERLKPYGLNFSFDWLSQTKAIEEIFDKQLILKFDSIWYENLKDYWKNIFKEKNESFKELEELEKIWIDNLSLEQLKEIYAIIEYNPEFWKDSFKYIEKIYNTEKPLSDATKLDYGLSLLEKWDEKWILVLEKLLDVKDFIDSIFANIIDFYEKKWDNLNVKKWKDKMENFFDKDYFAEKERNSFSKKDELEELDNQDLENLKAMKDYILNSDKAKYIKSILVVKKKLNYFKKKPLYIFLIKLNFFTLNTTIDDIIEFLVLDMMNNIESKWWFNIIFYWDDGSFFNWDFRKIRKNWINLFEIK